MARWYAVRHERGLLGIAIHSIRAAGFAPYSPYVMRADTNLGSRQEPLFPGYILVSWADGADWGPIARAHGVKHILSMDRRKPTPIPRGVVEAIIESEHERRIVLDPRPFLFAAGVPLRVLSGPFLGETGLCLWAKTDRVGLLLKILGGQRAVTIDPRHLALA